MSVHATYPGKVFATTVVFGKTTIETFLRYCLPTYLSEGNLPAIAARSNLVVHIHTLKGDQSFFEGSAAIQTLKKIADVRFFNLDDILAQVRGNKMKMAYSMMSEGHRRSVRAAYQDSAPMILLPGDVIMSDGSLKSAMESYVRGKKIVCTLGHRVTAETFLPSFDNQFPLSDIGTRTPPSRALAKLGAEHFHPYTLGLIARPNGFNHLMTPTLYWEVGQGNYVIKNLYPTPLIISPTTATIPANDTYDGEWINSIAQESSQCGWMDDSDDCLLFDLCEANRFEEYPMNASFDPAWVAKFIQKAPNISRLHYEMFPATMFYHHEPLDERFFRVEADASQLIFNILQMSRDLQEGKEIPFGSHFGKQSTPSGLTSDNNQDSSKKTSWGNLSPMRLFNFFWWLRKVPRLFDEALDRLESRLHNRFKS